jgi:hypothetical protein
MEDSRLGQSSGMTPGASKLQERFGGYVPHEGRLIDAKWAAEMEQFIPRELWKRVRDDRARHAHPQRKRSGRVPPKHLMAANGPPLIDARTGKWLHARSERDTYRPEGGG